jgi:hypothetical protein
MFWEKVPVFLKSHMGTEKNENAENNGLGVPMHF